MIADVGQFLVSGILVGVLYGLIALAIVLIYKATHVFNFATGSMLVLTSFFIWTFYRLGVPMWASALIGMGLSYLLGLLIERTVMRPLIGQPIISSMMATLALAELLRGVTIIIWTAHEFRPLEPVFPTIIQKLGPVVISPALFGSFVASAVCVLGLILFFRYSPIGLSMRAVAEGHYIAQSIGINVTHVFAVTWGIAGFLCAIAGLCLMDRVGFSVVQTPGIVIACFAAVLTGGLDSVPGAILGGVIVGVANSLAGGLIGAEAGMIMPYIVMMIVILVRPEGIWGLKRIERI